MDDLNFVLTEVLCVPVLLHALFYEFAHSQVRLICLETGSCPNICYMVCSELVTTFFAHTENKQGILIFELFEVKHSNREVPFWETEKLWLEKLLLLHLVFILSHLFADCNYFLVLRFRRLKL